MGTRAPLGVGTFLRQAPSADDRWRTLEAGFVEHLAKPVAAADLVAAVRQSIRLPEAA